ncbi:MAG: bifunctional folylpolyglutamate synthase/dihydrofolate synthase, partial [Clostridia bacterium]|nr:bifunctional folylpolyglutamate synthase/dihydrofolate synthase [Clostridia bacterium]
MNIMFICTGNICRSAMADGMMKKLVEENNIDVGVIECGLGGRLDATNCLDKKISVITNIGFDHMQTLGNT